MFVLTTQYVYYNSFIYFIKEITIHQPNNIDIVIIIPCVLDR